MITGIQHISFTVSSLEDTVDFFEQVLGLKATPFREAKGERAEKILQMPGASLRICNMITPGNGSIEFIEYLVPRGQKIDLRTCNIGVAHMAFTVDDIQKMYDELTAKGVQFNHPPIWSEEGVFKGWGICYVQGPDGITMEFMRPPEGVALHPATGFVLGGA